MPAIGILNVWVNPIEEILNREPEVPTAKYCSVDPIPFKVDKPKPADVLTAAPQVTAIPEESTTNAWLVEPIPSLVQFVPL